MIAQFLVLTLEEEEVVTRVSLTSEGLESVTKFILTSTLEGSFETELEAMKRVEELLEGKTTFEVEVKKVFIKG